MQKSFTNLATLALLGYVSLVGAQEDQPPMFQGACPTYKPFDLDMTKLANKSFQLLYGERESNGGYCIENKFIPFADGKNASRWQLNTVQRIPQELLDGLETSKGQYINFNNDEYILVFRDTDKDSGVTNLGHIFKANDLTDEKKDTIHESTMGMQWRIIHTDYDKSMMMSACFETRLNTNKDGQTKEQAEKALQDMRQIDYKEYVASEAMSVMRENLSFKQPFINVVEQFKREKGTYEEEHAALTAAVAEDYQSQVIVKDIAELVMEGKVTWEQQREWLLMPLEEFKMIYEPAKAELVNFLDVLEQNTYDDKFDMNFDTETIVHDHILHLFVNDINQYKDEASFDKIKATLFEKFDDPSYEKTIGEHNGKRDDSVHCPHFAEKKSLFEMELKTGAELQAEMVSPNDQEEPQMEVNTGDEETTEEVSELKDDL